MHPINTPNLPMMSISPLRGQPPYLSSAGNIQKAGHTPLPPSGSFMDASNLRTFPSSPASPNSALRFVTIFADVYDGSPTGAVRYRSAEIASRPPETTALDDE